MLKRIFQKDRVLNIAFIIELILFVLIISGIIPRLFAVILAIFLAVYVLIAPIGDGVMLFVRSIPIFIAIPFTESFDSLNAWRIVSVILFLKWAFLEVSPVQTLRRMAKSVKKPSTANALPALLLILLLAFISVIPAGDKIAALKRIIYFINLSLVGIVLQDLASKSGKYKKKIISNITIPVAIAVLFGIIQLVMTYFIDIYSFIGIWGQGVQCRQFGMKWCTIAVEMGNTWFAYYGSQLSLRVFSLFPDTHSFPIFLLLGLPAFFALALRNIDLSNLKRALKKRLPNIATFIPVIMFIMILTGTRGIWAASVGAFLIACLFLYITKKQGIDAARRNILRYIMVFFVIFALLFITSQPIFSSNQFRIPKEDSALLKKRVKSILDFNETSNATRLQIWKSTIESIRARPLIGVGIGNFPVILDENIELSKAGSSAHNLYLHIAAEMGIPALLAFLWFLWAIIKKAYGALKHEDDRMFAIYNGATLVFLPWVLFYSLTDFALFDGRAFLLFVITAALVLSSNIKGKSGGRLPIGKHWAPR